MSSNDHVLDDSYWADAAVGAALFDELAALHSDDSVLGRARRQTVAAELSAVEAHLLRHVLEASQLAVGKRVLPSG
jgi:hypothetical protein